MRLVQHRKKPTSSTNELVTGDMVHFKMTGGSRDVVRSGVKGRRLGTASAARMWTGLQASTSVCQRCRKRPGTACRVKRIPSFGHLFLGRPTSTEA